MVWWPFGKRRQAANIAAIRAALEEYGVEATNLDSEKAIVAAAGEFVRVIVRGAVIYDAFYENPADESRAPELWQNQNLWLKVEKLLYVQMESFNTFRQFMRDISTQDEREFFRDAPDRFNRIEKLVDEELIKPTASLSDLVRSTHH